MTYSSVPPVCWMLLFGITFYVVSTYSIITYPFKDNCVYNNHMINEDDTNYITYNGERLDKSSCSIGFYGRGDFFDEFKVCVEPKIFEIRSCDIKVIYYGDNRFHDRTYSCYEQPKTFCVADGEFLHIEIKRITHWKTNDKFQLRVYALKTYDCGKLDIQFGLRLHGGCVATTGRVYSSRAPIITFEVFENSMTVAVIVGSVIGGLALLSIIVVCTVMQCKKNKRHEEGRVIAQHNPMGYSAVVYTAPPLYPETPAELYNAQQQHGDSPPPYSAATASKAPVD